MAGEAVRLLTYNVRMLPRGARWLPVVMRGSQRDSARAAGIVRSLSEDEPLYDVICLQELNAVDMFDFVRAGLASSHEHRTVSYGGEGLFKQRSGIFTASRFPIAEDGRASGFHAWKDANGWDRLADKGVVGVLLEIGSGRFLYVFNVHLQSDRGPVGENHATRSKQLAELEAFIAEFREQHPAPDPAGIVVCGDLNIAAGSPEHARLKALGGGYVDAWEEAKEPGPGLTWQSGDNDMIPQTDGDLLRLDYHLMRPGADPALALTVCSVAKFGPGTRSRLSDHYGVACTLQLG